jgi:hypothetical protein
MASPNSAFVEAAVMTLGAYSTDFADNITKTNALVDAMDKAGNVKQNGYGRELACDIEYAENSTISSYQGYEVLDITPSESFTRATYPWKQAAVSITYSGAEVAVNSGPEAVHDLIKSRTKNAKNTAANYMGRQVYGNGTGNGGRDLGGLGLLVPDIPTNTVGNISAASNPFWQNKVYSFSGQATPITTVTGPALLHAMNTIWLQLSRGKDHPDIITCDSLYYNTYLESLQPNQRFTSITPDRAGYGFTEVLYKQTPVVYDDVCPAQHMYLLNTDYLGMTTMKDRNWKPLGDRSPVNQDATVLSMVWMGAMWCSNRALQGVIIP